MTDYSMSITGKEFHR